MLHEPFHCRWYSWIANQCASHNIRCHLRVVLDHLRVEHRFPEQNLDHDCEAPAFLWHDYRDHDLQTMGRCTASCSSLEIPTGFRLLRQRVGLVFCHDCVRVCILPNFTRSFRRVDELERSNHRGSRRGCDSLLLHPRVRHFRRTGGQNEES